MSSIIADYTKTKQIVCDSMAIIQSLMDLLSKRNVHPGISHLEQELLIDLEGHYSSGEEVVRDIEAIENDLPPWDEAYE